MKRYIAPLFAALLLAAAPALARSPQDGPRAVGAEGSGRLIVQTDESAEQAHVHAAFRAGSLYEPAGVKGVAWVLAAALESSPLATWLEERGGALSAEADVDTLRVDLACAPGDLAEASERLGARLASSRWTEAEVQGARDRLASELAAAERTAAGRAERAMDQIVYAEYPEYYRVPLASAVSAVRAADVTAFHAAHVGADRMVVGVRGGSPEESMAAALRDGLADLGDVGAAPPDPMRPQYCVGETLIYVVDVPDAERTEIRISSPAVRRDASTFFPLEAWAYAMTGGEGALLWDVVVGNELAERIAAEFDAGWDRLGPMRCSLTTPNDKAGKALEVFIETMQRTRAEVERTEVVAGHEHFRAEEALAVADPAKRIRRAVELELFGYPPDWYERRADWIVNTVPDGVREAVRRQVRVRTLTIVVAGPADEIRKGLEYYAPTTTYVENPPRDPEAMRRALAMLDAMGGRELWAKFTGASMKGSVFVLQGKKWERRDFQQWFAVDRAQTRLEQDTLRGFVTTVVNGDPGWTQTNLITRGMSNPAYRAKLLRQRRWIYSVLHRLAIDDPSMGVTQDEEGRLVFADRLGEIFRLQLGEDDRPASASWTVLEQPQGIDFQEFGEVDGYVYPKKTTIPFAYRALEEDVPQEILEFVPNAEIDPALLERPAEEG